MAEFKIFTRGDFLITDATPEEPYRRRAEEEKFNVHWGQLKLMMTEIEFFCLFWYPETTPNPVVVYAGAAPGTHIPFLASMFPSFIFHLYDPRDFTITGTEQIHIHQQYFTDQDAAQWAGRNDVLFLSDIRTADHITMKDTENEEAIMADMAMQERWYRIIQPAQAHLKYRLPYTYDFAPKNVQGLYGFIFRQAWAPQTSTETRLVPIVPARNFDWNVMKYQSQLFYHNSVVRETFKYFNPFDGSQNPIAPEMGLTNDYDSTMHIITIMDYLKKMGGEEAVTKENVLGLSEAIVTSIGRGLKSIKTIRDRIARGIKKPTKPNKVKTRADTAKPKQWKPRK